MSQRPAGGDFVGGALAAPIWWAGPARCQMAARHLAAWSVRPRVLPRGGHHAPVAAVAGPGDAAGKASGLIGAGAANSGPHRLAGRA